MKRGLIWTAVAILAGLTAYCCMRLGYHNEHRKDGALPGLLWLRQELKLNDAQFFKVQALHKAYSPKCGAMSERITAAHAKIDVLTRETTGLTTEVRAALKEHADLHLECQQTMLEHFYETAAVMDSTQGRRYLELMLPYATDFSHSERTAELSGGKNTQKHGSH